MRRIILNLSAVMALLASLLLFSCGEEHSHSKGIVSSDASHHWYACIGCDAQLEKAEHKWDNGTVTIQPTKNQKGEKTYMCSGCNRLKKEDIEMIKEIEVTGAEWESAFAFDSFQNVTATITETIKNGNDEIKTVYTIEASGLEIYLAIVKYKNGTETEYYGKYQSGYQVWEFNQKGQTIEDAHYSTSMDVMSTENILKDYRLDLGAFFGSFTFDGEKGIYVADSLENGNMHLENVEASFVNGKLQRVKADGNLSTVEIIFSDYDKTKPQPPTQNKK